MRHFIVFCFVCTFCPLHAKETSSSFHLDRQESQKVLVWNTFKGRKEKFQEDAQELFQNHDFLLLQEVVFNDFFLELIQGPKTIDIQEAVSWGENGVSTAAPLPNTGSYPLRTTDRELLFFTPKASLVTKYLLKSTRGEEIEVLILNVHMINFTSLGPFKNQLELFRPFLAKHHGPIIAAGDFNTWSSAREEEARSFMESFGMHELDFYKTLQSSQENAYFGILDRVYIRGLDVFNLRVHDEIETSDHFPLSFEFRSP